MKFLSKKEIIEADDHKREVVSVPEWGGHVYVKTLTGIERDAFESSLVGRPGNETGLVNIRAKLCAKAMVDERGKPLFTHLDVRELGKKSANALDRVFQVAQRLNGLVGSEIEELVKNSETDHSDASTSS